MYLISQKHPQWKTPDNDTANYLNWQCNGNIYWTCGAELTRLIVYGGRTIRLFNSQGVALPARECMEKVQSFITMVLRAKQQGAPCRSFFFSFLFLSHQGTLSSAQGAGEGLISKASTRTQQQLEESVTGRIHSGRLETERHQKEFFSGSVFLLQRRFPLISTLSVSSFHDLSSGRVKYTQPV